MKIEQALQEYLIEIEVRKFTEPLPPEETKQYRNWKIDVRFNVCVPILARAEVIFLSLRSTSNRPSISSIPSLSLPNLARLPIRSTTSIPPNFDFAKFFLALFPLILPNRSKTPCTFPKLLSDF